MITALLALVALTGVAKGNNETLPDAKIKAGVATVKVQVSGYDPAKALSLTTSRFTPVADQEELELNVPLNADGTAVAEIPMHLAQMARVNIGDICGADILLAPDETIEIVAELDGDNGKITAFKGFMAQTHTDYNGKLDFDSDGTARKLCEDLDKCTTPQERIDCLKADMNERMAFINSLSVTEATKALLRMGIESQYLDWRYRYGLNNVGIRSYLRMIKRPTPEEYDRLVEKYDSLLPPLPAETIGTEEYLELLGAPYAPCVMDYYLFTKTPMMGYIGQDGKVNTYNRDIRTMRTLIRGGHNYDTGQLFASIEHEDCKQLAEQCLAAQHQRAAELSKADAVYCHSHDDVPPEDILQVILDKYKGKVVFIDIWATWCAPCLKGHKAIQPIKEELKDKGIVFVYLTSPVSPLSTWESMIPEISGENYYLTEAQMSHILNHYKSTGYPTYAIYDKNGRQTFLTTGFHGIEKMKAKLTEILSGE